MESTKREISLKQVYTIAIMGMIINSFISPTLSLILKTGMHSAVITFYRLFLVSVLMMPMVIFNKDYRENLKGLDKKGVLQLGGYSLTKAGGFLLWAEALRMGTPAFTMTTLSNMAPIFVVIFAYIFLKEKTSLKAISGIAICLIGVTIISLENMNQLGSAISLITIFACCICNSLNTIAGKVVRGKLELIPMMGVSYFICSLICGGYALWLGADFAIPKAAILPLLALSWGCTMLGHSTSIWTLRYLKPVNTSVLNLASPFFTAITAFFLLREVPKPIMFVGALIMICGLYRYQKAEYLG